MAVVVAERELIRSCRILFGAHLHVSREFLEYLQKTGLKRAYRQRAFETHPDTAGEREIPGGIDDGESFLSVRQAYENLTNYLVARGKGYRFPTFRSLAGVRGKGFSAGVRRSPAGPSRPFRTTSRKGFNQKGRQGAFSRNKARWSSDAIYQGPLPARRLLLGHFLYYAGIISWRTVIQALVWQRTNRPRLGEIGRRFGWLTEDDVRLIVRTSQGRRRPFGKVAIKLGKLSESQLRLVVFYQKCLQRKIGEFFLEQEMLSPDDLEKLVTWYKEHNAAFASPFGKKSFGG